MGIHTCLSFGSKLVGSRLSFKWNHIIGNLGTPSMLSCLYKFHFVEIVKHWRSVICQTY